MDAIITRRTSRRYADAAVDRKTFEWIVHQAMHAPTACNEQQWKIILIESPSIIRDLYARGSASFLQDTKQCFLLCYNRQTDNLHWLDHVQSGAAFITLFQLVAHTIGIGSCWIGHLPNKSELGRVFKIHRAYEPVALVSFGYYRNKTRMMERKHDTADLIMLDRFDSSKLHLESQRRTFFRTIGRYIYYKIPAVFRRPLKPFTQRFEKKFYYESYD